MPVLEVKLKRPHFSQKEIIQDAKRYNHLRCGRRFGKTALIEYLCSIALQGKRVGVWYPTSKDAADVWFDIKQTYNAVITHKNEQLKQLRLYNGGIIDFWSMDEPQSGQGRKYHRAIIDEAAKARNLLEALGETIRPTLTDYQGDLWVMSRPRGRANPFYELEDKNQGQGNWAFFHYTTYDNPFILRDEIQEAKQYYEADPLIFQQEYMAEYVDMNNMPFFYNFSHDKHVQQVTLKDNQAVKLSFDFNLDPFSCIAYQENELGGLDYFMQIKLSNSDILQMCDYIRAQFAGKMLIVTGDRSGYNRMGTVRGKTSYWAIIRDQLRLSDANIRLRSKNLDLVESRILCNLAFNKKAIRIDPSMTDLIRDLTIASVDERGELIKDRSKNKMDFADCLRYSIDAEWPDLVANI